MNLKNKEQLKTELLEKNLVVDNEYLDLYVELIVANYDTKKEKYKTQQHHIIPRYYYNRNNLKLDNSNENLVILLFCDHILAHYYLSKCSISPEFQSCNLHALNIINISSDLLDVDKSAILHTIQIAYEDFKHANLMNETIRKKISQTIKGSISILKDGEQKYVKPEFLDEYLNVGWELGHNRQTDDSKRRISEDHKGKIFIHNDAHCIRICPEELSDYIDRGYKVGMGKRKNPFPIKGRIALNKDGIIKYVYSQDDVDKLLSEGFSMGTNIHNSPANKGKKLPAELVARRAESRKGMIAIHSPDGKIKYVKPELVDQFTLSGWLLGTGNHVPSVAGKIKIQNGDTKKYIDKDELNDYMQNGWQPVSKKYRR